MGRAKELWDELAGIITSGAAERIPELYTADAVYLEPFNPPHNGNLLIQAYLKDYLAGKDERTVGVKRAVEDDAGAIIAVEWTLSYTSGGRRWNNLPRATVIEVGDKGMIVYHRDYQ